MSSINLEYRITGYSSLEFKGEQLQRFFNICFFRCIDIINLEIYSNYAYAVVKNESLGLLRELAAKYKVTIKVKKEGGIPYYLRYYGKRWGFILGALMCYSFLIYMSGGIWEMEFKGNSYHTDDALISYLKEEGIHYGCRMRELDCEEMELQIRKTFSDIAWCSLQQDGCKLTLTITESNMDTIAQSETNQLEEGTGISLIADREATITGIVTQEGQPAVVAGQQVLPGDVLVQGYIVYTDDFDTITGYKGVVAKAIITASYTVTYELKVSLKKPEGTSVLTEYHQLEAVNKIFPHLYYKVKEKYPHGKGEFFSKEEGRLILENRYYEQLKIWEENGYEVIEKKLKIEDNNNEMTEAGTVLLQGPLGVEAPCKIPDISEEVNEFDGN